MSKFCDNLINNNNKDPDLTTNEIWVTFKAELDAGIQKFIPTRVLLRKRKSTGFPYVDKEIKRLVKKRDKLHAKKGSTVSGYQAPSSAIAKPEQPIGNMKKQLPQRNLATLNKLTKDFGLSLNTLQTIPQVSHP